MKLVRNIFLTVIAVLAVLLLAGGCGTEPQTETTPAEMARIQLMQKVPVYYESFDFWDVGTLRSDPDLAEMHREWQGRRGSWLANFGIGAANVDYAAEAGVLTIATGEFSLQDIRDSLANDYYRDTSYTDAEVWVARPTAQVPRIGGAVILTEGLFVWGNKFNIDDYLRVAGGEELSMYDRNAAEVLERLPGGVMTRISRSAYPKGVIISGMSVRKEGESTLRWTNLFKFESTETAGSVETNEYFKNIEDDFKKAQGELTARGEASPFRDFNLVRDGEFVKWSILIDEKYMIALLFYG